MTEDEHLLSCLAEECAEVAHRVSKALRFGLTEVQPGQDLTNAQRIAEELIDPAISRKAAEKLLRAHLRKSHLGPNRGSQGSTGRCSGPELFGTWTSQEVFKGADVVEEIE